MSNTEEELVGWLVTWLISLGKRRKNTEDKILSIENTVISDV